MAASKQIDASPNQTRDNYTPLKDAGDSITPAKTRVKSSVNRYSTSRKLTVRTQRLRRSSPTKDTNQSMNASKNSSFMPSFAGTVSLNDPTSVTMQNSFLIKNH